MDCGRIAMRDGSDGTLARAVAAGSFFFDMPLQKKESTLLLFWILCLHHAVYAAATSRHDGAAQCRVLGAGG